MDREEKDFLLERIMIEYGNELVRLAFYYVKDAEVAKDLVQNTFIKCYKNLESFRFDAQIKTWLYRITINECKDYLKSWYAKHVAAASDDIFTQTQSADCVEAQIVQQEQDDELVRAVLALPIKYREVIYLCYYEEQSMKEIADILQLNESTVKTRLRTAKQLLKKRLEREERG